MRRAAKTDLGIRRLQAALKEINEDIALLEKEREETKQWLHAAVVEYTQAHPGYILKEEP